MPRTFVKELSDGDTVNEFFLLADKQLRANRNADLYLLATLRDKTGVISGLMWNVSEERMQHFSAGDIVHVKGKVQLYQGGLQMIVTFIDTAPESAYDAEDFQIKPQANVGPLLDQLKELLGSIKCEKLRTLGQCFLSDQQLLDDLCAAPAGVKAHHAYQGGLIEHIVSMAQVADRLCDHYPSLNRDLLLLGVLMHDLGKVRELSWDPTLAYTDEGQLLGHMNIAVEILNEKLAVARAELGSKDFDTEDVLRLKHMILSHHGTHEFGSPRVPMTPEAIVLHHIDNLDAKLHEFTRAIEDDMNKDSAWTPYSPRIERKLFKGYNNE
ncbi:3'-5' exoribonuclease YhaM family protein [Fuerstiella marisgermanici]|uniref:3'-5' exoribonuclease YhaM n=1 Tax=Fuerstiella marisgermanici TaxID=1891926 RepID=A0A1P8WP27_9PLAN|nr:HD domain-containing protein [Fuerstiella marisgermanici]APZ95809.1 3'-5' exoribonuclease YhaM [Fuerstiella marisgermanici]